MINFKKKKKDIGNRTKEAEPVIPPDDSLAYGFLNNYNYVLYLLGHKDFKTKFDTAHREMVSYAMGGIGLGYLFIIFFMYMHFIYFQLFNLVVLLTTCALQFAPEQMLKKLAIPVWVLMFLIMSVLSVVDKFDKYDTYLTFFSIFIIMTVITILLKIVFRIKYSGE